MVRIVSESSIAAGIRRIEAITGEAVEKLMDTQQDILLTAKEFFNNAPDLIKAIQRSIEENNELSKKINDFMQEKIQSMRDKLMKEAKEVNGIKEIRVRTMMPAEAIKTLSFQIRNVLNEKLFIVIGNEFEGKPSLTVLLSDDLVAEGYNAVNMVREGAKFIQGGGGGQPFFATAGGKNPAGLDEAIKSINL